MSLRTPHTTSCAKGSPYLVAFLLHVLIPKEQLIMWLYSTFRVSVSSSVRGVLFPIRRAAEAEGWLGDVNQSL